MKRLHSSNSGGTADRYDTVRPDRIRMNGVFYLIGKIFFYQLKMFRKDAPFAEGCTVRGTAVDSGDGEAEGE